ncbi:MAG: acyltransferase family protein [Microbacteriaceae bacterium]|nr:acyltransferase family protein [Microbacteriaceae bacterium]
MTLKLTRPATSQDETKSHAKTRLRLDIQALRAIAVLLVVINHLWPKQLTGGFIGVDIFFVISGFLITAHLLKELTSTGQLRFARFYARRARRLLPAALIVTAVSLILTVMFVPLERWHRAAFEAFAASTYFENWALFSSATNYFTQETPPTAQQHYWSLSVEEQFYLAWPLLLFVLFWIAYRAFHKSSSDIKTASDQAISTVMSGRLRTFFICAVIAIAVVSLLFSQHLVATSPAGAYFHTFGRVWEFMLGALVALIAPIASQNLRVYVRTILQAMGWLAIAVTALIFSAKTPFPGFAALIPTLGTALIIFAGPAIPLAPLRWLTGWKPVQFIGDISYSLYLWHWPLIVVLPFIVVSELGIKHKIGILIVSVALATLTKYAVEDPGRKFLLVKQRSGFMLATAVIASVIMGIACIGIAQQATTQQQQIAERRERVFTGSCFGANAILHKAKCADKLFGPATLQVGGESEAPWGQLPKTCKVRESRKTPGGSSAGIVDCDFSNGSKNAEHIWVSGDSHAGHLEALLAPLVQKNYWKITFSEHGGCPAMPVRNIANTPETNSCFEFASEVMEKIITEKPTRVIFAAKNSRVQDDSMKSPEQLQLEKLSNYKKATEPHGASITVVREIPLAGDAIGASCTTLKKNATDGCITSLANAQKNDLLFAAAVKLSQETPTAGGAAPVSTIDFTDYICPDGTCHGIVGGVPVFYDSNHLSYSFARSLTNVAAKKLQKLWNIEVKS